MTFELLKEHLLERYDGMPPPWAILGAGMTSSSIAQFASYPLALVRTRMQVRSSAGRSSRDIISDIVILCAHHHSHCVY